MHEPTIEAIYDAAAHPDRWPFALERIAETLGAVGALLLFRRQDGRVGTICSPAFDQAAEDYQANWAHRDLRAERGFQFFASGQGDAATDVDLVTEEEIRTEPIFQDFLLPRGLLWTAGATASPEPNVGVILSVIRSSNDVRFSPEDLERLQGLSRHAERSLSLTVRLIDAEAVKLGLSRALDLLECGVVVIDRKRKVIFQNGAARELLGSGLSIVAGKLRSTWPEDQSALADALRTAEDGLAAAPRPCIVLDGRSETPLVVRALPLPGGLDGEALGSALTMVLIVRQKSGEPLDPALIRDVLKLTLGESRLASLIGVGMSPREASQALGIQESTVRYILKRIFAKTNIARQSELVMLLTKLQIGRRQGQISAG